MAEVVALADYSIKIEDEEFNVCRVPDTASKLVARKKQEVLANFDLSELIAGLRRSGTLLFLAYNGVAGFGALRAATNALQDKLGVLCRDCELALLRFSRNTATILDKLQRNFGFLVQGKEAIAIRFLQQCAETAGSMAKEATDLATRFDNLANETIAVCGNTEIQQGKTDEERRQLERDLNDLKAKSAAAAKLSTELAELRKKLQKLYDEAKAKEETAAERGFALQMVGAIMGPIAQGVGAFAGMYASAASGAGAAGALKNVVNAPATPPPAPMSSSPEKTAAEEKLEEAKAEAASAQEELEEAEQALETAKEEEKEANEKVTEKITEEELATEKESAAVADAEEDPKNSKLKREAAKAKLAREEATAEREEAEEEQAAKKIAVEEAEAVVEEKKSAAALAAEAVQKATRAVETAAQNLSAVGSDLMDMAKIYEAEKKEYLEKLLQYEHQEAEALASVAEYAVRMTNVTSLVEVNKTVSLSLCQAIAAFNAVAQILRNAAQFWTQMADACRTLQSEGVQATVKAFSDLPAEERAAMWKQDAFKREAVEYMAHWKALELICNDYSKAAGETRTEIQANIKTSPSPEESMKLTPELAKALHLDAKRAENAAIEREEAIQAQLEPLAA